MRRLKTSAAQFYRLLDQTNIRKSVDQMLRLLAALNCSVELPRPETPADRADRIIIATALSLGGRVVTRDKRITSCRAVATVW